MSIFEFNRAIVREPARSVIYGLTSQTGPRPAFDSVAREHGEYVKALERCGLSVDTLPALEAFPDSVFVEDPALVLGSTAITLRPGARTRFGEAAHLAAALRERFTTVLEMESGFADGGDMLLTPPCMMIGLSSRTNRQGATDLVALLQRAGIESRIVDTPSGTLHLKSDCAMVAPDRILCTPSLAASDAFNGFHKLITPAGEERAANSLRLNDTILVGMEFPLTAALLRSEGLNVLMLPVGAIGSLDAGLSCMSLRWNEATAGG